MGVVVVAVVVKGESEGKPPQKRKSTAARPPSPLHLPPLCFSLSFFLSSFFVFHLFCCFSFVLSSSNVKSLAFSFH